MGSTNGKKQRINSAQSRKMIQAKKVEGQRVMLLVFCSLKAKNDNSAILSFWYLFIEFKYPFRKGKYLKY
jgi:hypothetical protein